MPAQHAPHAVVVAEQTQDQPLSKRMVWARNGPNPVFDERDEACSDGRWARPSDVDPSKAYDLGPDGHLDRSIYSCAVLTPNEDTFESRRRVRAQLAARPQQSLILGAPNYERCKVQFESDGEDALGPLGHWQVLGKIRRNRANFVDAPCSWLTIDLDGMPVEAGRPLLRFDTQELMTKLRDKRNALNEKQKELERTRIVAKETVAELSL